MFFIFRPFNVIIFIVVVILAMLSVYWLDGWDKAKNKGENLSFFEYVKTDIKKTKGALKTLPEIIGESVKSADRIRIGSLNKLAEALDMYQMDHQKYPGNITELLGDYIDPKTKIFKEKTLYYYLKLDGGYKMGITLENDKVYEIER